MTTVSLEKIALDSIIPDPHQPRHLPPLDVLIKRKEAGDYQATEIWQSLLTLATSILEVGLEQPITVYPAEETGKYIIYDGHRRWTAVNLLQRQGQGDGFIQCYIRANPESDEDILLGQLNVNIQRKDLNVFELARSLQRVHENLQLNGGTVRLVREDGTIEPITLLPLQSDDIIWGTIEKKLGIQRSRRYQIQAVLKLPPRIQQIAEAAALPESRLRYLIPIKDEQILEIIIKEMVEQKLSNAQIRKRLKALQAAAETPPEPTMPKPMGIKSAITPINKLIKDLEGVKNIPAIVSDKDPRTVQSYRALLPELRNAIKGLEDILDHLKFLETE